LLDADRRLPMHALLSLGASRKQIVAIIVA
jgi:hypothetical protein